MSGCLQNLVLTANRVLSGHVPSWRRGSVYCQRLSPWGGLLRAQLASLPEVAPDFASRKMAVAVVLCRRCYHRHVLRYAGRHSLEDLQEALVSRKALALSHVELRNPELCSLHIPTTWGQGGEGVSPSREPQALYCTAEAG